MESVLKEDSRKIREEKNMLVPADKTHNFYSLSPHQYGTLMRDNVTTAYQKADQESVHTTNLEAKRIANNLELSDRIYVLAQKPSYITLKDHKENFRSHPTCRLINPAKSEIGIISKQTLDRINKTTLEATKINQWKNSGAVIEWFKTRQKDAILHSSHSMLSISTPPSRKS